jgi:hypothetical protein
MGETNVMRCAGWIHEDGVGAIRLSMALLPPLLPTSSGKFFLLTATAKRKSSAFWFQP